VASLLLALDQIDGQTSPGVIAGADRNGFGEAAGTLTSDWIDIPVCGVDHRQDVRRRAMLEHPLLRTCAVLDSDHLLELEASGCMQFGRSDLGVALKSEIQRLAGGSRLDQEAGRKHELACLRMASVCMELAGDAHSPDLQRQFLKLARQLIAAAEPIAAPALAT
jgi:hypothetical protein